MIVSTTARRIQELTALFLAAALLLRFGLTTFDAAPGDAGLLTRWLRYFSYFTIQSNIACLIASLAVLSANRLDTPWQRALRLASLVGITITCAVYIAILAKDSNEAGLSQVANLMLHYIGPPLVIVGWLAAGPNISLRLADIPRAMIWPLLWTAYTLLHGAISGWYPYDFIDVGAKGYGAVSVSLLLIFALAVSLSALFVAAGRMRWRGRGSDSAGDRAATG